MLPISFSSTNFNCYTDSYTQTFQIESNRKKSAVEKTLRAHDRVAKAENERRQFNNATTSGNGTFQPFNLVHGMSFGAGCRCCYDPNIDGGDYELLAAAKEELLAATTTSGVNEGSGEGEDALSLDANNKLLSNDNKRNNYSNGDDDSSSDDSEFDYLLDEDIPGLSSEYESQRRAELEDLAQRTEVLRYHGYGVHRQMHPKRLFVAAGYGTDTQRDVIRPRGSVIHLFDAFSQRSVAMDLYLERIASNYPGTKFVRGIGVTSIFYADHNGDDDSWKKGKFPMLLALKEGKVVAWNAGMEDFFSSEELESRAVEQWLQSAGVLVDSPPDVDEICRIRPEETALLENLMKLNRLEEEDIGEERYDCGVPGCCKPFHHEHVGVKNEVQHGMLVTEDMIKDGEMFFCQEISS